MKTKMQRLAFYPCLNLGMAFLTLLSLTALFFAACGSDSSSGVDTAETSEVKTIHGLGDCKGSNNGITKLVTSENRYYTCANGQWSVSWAYIDTVKTDDDLPACLSKNEGDSVFVLSEMSVFRCQSSKWKNEGFVMGSYETKSKLPACEEMFDGLKGFVKNDSVVYVCNGVVWEAWADAYASEKDLPNCNSRREWNHAWLLDRNSALVCVDGTWARYDVEQTPNSSSSEGKSGNSSSNGNSGYSSDSKAAAVAPSTVVKGMMADERDGQIYKTVKIGDQTWMAENLNYRYLGPTAEEDSSSFCYNNSPRNCDEHGRLYLWSAAMDSAGIIKGNTANGCGYGSKCSPNGTVRGVCPQGWHLPDTTEWGILIDAVGGKDVACKKLKSTSGWYDDGNGTDDYAFSARPVGRGHGGWYTGEGREAPFWSSTEGNSDIAYDMGLYCDYGIALPSGDGKFQGFSVRCLKNVAPVDVDPSTVVKGTMTDERDGQTYKTVKIGDQTWMAENLNYRYLGPTADEDSSSFCYDNDPDKCDSYGRLYLWSAAMDSAGIIKGNTANGCGYYSVCSPSETMRGVCPQGWHLPSYNEWGDLLTAVGDSSVAGKMLKFETGWELYSGIENNDAFGFSALPAGYRYNDGSYDAEGYYAYFWCSTEAGYGSRSYSPYLNYGIDNASLNINFKSYGFSVRCLKD